MGMIQAFTGAIGGTFADQWKDIITAGFFDEHTVVAPGVLKQTNNGRGSNTQGSDGVLTTGSKIFIPENTAAFVFSQSRIEEVITQAGGYEYTAGQDSIFTDDDDSLIGRFSRSIVDQAKQRLAYGGQTDDEKRVAYVNLREIRGIKFGTKGPLMYNDGFYGTDLSVQGYGHFSLQVTDPTRFIQNFVPANTSYYTFDDAQVRSQILSEFLQSFMVSLNALSAQYRISQLPAQANMLVETIKNDGGNAGTWQDRFGFELRSVAIENISFSADSQALVHQYSENKMNVKAYEDVSQQAADIAAQQNISKGINQHGFGDAAGMVIGANMAQHLDPMTARTGSTVPQSQATPGAATLSLAEQIEMVKKLQELLTAGILSQEEFDLKKKEILGL